MEQVDFLSNFLTTPSTSITDSLGILPIYLIIGFGVSSDLNPIAYTVYIYYLNTKNAIFPFYLTLCTLALKKT